MHELKPMLISEFLHRYTSGKYKLSSAWSEYVELWDEILAMNWSGIVEEFGDVVMTTQLWFATLTGWDWRIRIPDATHQKVIDRMRIWEEIFASHGLEFHPKYLMNGSNYHKEEKVKAAIALARKYQS
jgi:hypothetical protein